MKIDDTFHYTVRRANAMARIFQGVEDDPVAEKYVSLWAKHISNQVKQIHSSGGIALLNLPEA